MSFEGPVKNGGAARLAAAGGGRPVYSAGLAAVKPARWTCAGRLRCAALGRPATTDIILARGRRRSLAAQCRRRPARAGTTDLRTASR
ncbi:hypothetical protein POK33_05380, partial [Burkholderia cenocepacia]|uniref:hypothetical protein n=1 Tax=Burkholderia cenocepacia TaxID=95486 RepID=UPI0023B9E094